MARDREPNLVATFLIGVLVVGLLDWSLSVPGSAWVATAVALLFFVRLHRQALVLLLRHPVGAPWSRRSLARLAHVGVLLFCAAWLCIDLIGRQDHLLGRSVQPLRTATHRLMPP